MLPQKCRAREKTQGATTVPRLRAIPLTHATSRRQFLKIAAAGIPALLAAHCPIAAHGDGSALAGAALGGTVLRQSVPGRLVVATFDDAVISDYTFIAPLLKNYGFGDTFFVCELPRFSDKTKYMSWKQIKSLSDMGFEIGNQTLTHKRVTQMNANEFERELAGIENLCEQYGIPRPVSFAYPAYETNCMAMEVLRGRQYWFARAGGNHMYFPGADSRLAIPSFGTSGSRRDVVLKALRHARNGQVAVLTTHGVPDTAHRSATTLRKLFRFYLRYMKQHGYQVIAMRDLAKYVDVAGSGVLGSDNNPCGVTLPPPPPRLSHPPQVVEVGSQVAAKRLVYKLNPTYPLTAKQKGIGGTVALTALIDKRGRVQQVKLISGNPLLAPAAMKAVKSWRYMPFVIDNRPVAMETEVDVHFISLNANDARAF